jgi:putative membrane protein
MMCAALGHEQRLDMILQSLSGVPAFLVYLVVAAALLAASVVIYTAITRHDEFRLIRSNVPGAAVALGLSAIGFALPLTSAIGHSANVIDCAIWGVIALIVQIAVYYLVRLSIPDLSERIQKGELAAAIWLGLISVTAGMLSAASMAL